MHLLELLKSFLKLSIPRVGEDVELLEPSTLLVGLQNYTVTLEKSFAVSLGSLRSRCLDRIRRSRGLLRQTFVRVDREGTGGDGVSCGFMIHV